MSPALFLNIDMAREEGVGENWVVSRIFAPDCSAAKMIDSISN